MGTETIEFKPAVEDFKGDPNRFAILIRVTIGAYTLYFRVERPRIWFDEMTQNRREWHGRKGYKLAIHGVDISSFWNYPVIDSGSSYPYGGTSIRILCLQLAIRANEYPYEVIDDDED